MLLASAEMAAKVNEYALIIGGSCSIAGSLYGVWRFVIYPHIYVKIHNMFNDVYNVAMDAASIHAIIKKELSTNGGSSLKDAINRIELKLALQDGKHKVTLSLLDVPIWESDENGNCLWVNRAYRRITGYDIDSVKDMGWVSIIASCDRERVSEEWESSVKDHRHFSLTYNILTPVGKVLSVDGEGYPIYLNDSSKNTVKGYIGVLLVKNS